MGKEISGIDLDEVSQPFPLIQKNVMVKLQNICCFCECPLTLDILRNTPNRVSQLEIIDHKGTTWLKVVKNDTERGSSISLFWFTSDELAAVT